MRRSRDKAGGAWPKEIRGAGGGRAFLPPPEALARAVPGQRRGEPRHSRQGWQRPRRHDAASGVRGQYGK